MARPARFSVDDVLDAALACVARDGHEVTVDDVAARLQCGVGAIYYRFSSRQVLLARLWIRSVQRYQEYFLAALAGPDPAQALTAAACTIPDYCRDHPDEARALTLFRQAALLAEAPDEIRDEVAHLNDDVLRELDATLLRRFGRTGDDLRALCRAAVQETPYGLVRPYIGTDRVIPGWLTDTVRASVPAVLALGDTW